MTSTYTTRNRLELQGTGDNPNTWGTRLNTNTLGLIDEAISGVEPIDVSGLSGAQELTASQLASDQARNLGLYFTGTPSANVTYTAPAVEKIYVVLNNIGGGFSISIGPSGGTYATLSSGLNLVMTDGTTTWSAALSTSTVSPLFVTTSQTTVTVGDLVVGSLVSLNVDAATTLQWIPAATQLRIAYKDNPTVFVRGPVASYSHPVVNVSAVSIGGTGTVNEWNIAPESDGIISDVDVAKGGVVNVTTGNVTLVPTSDYYQGIDISDITKSVILPDARNLEKGGPHFVINNESPTNSLAIRNGDSALVEVLKPEGHTQAFLVSVDTTAGNWKFISHDDTNLLVQNDSAFTKASLSNTLARAQANASNNRIIFATSLAGQIAVASTQDFTFEVGALTTITETNPSRSYIGDIVQAKDDLYFVVISDWTATDIRVIAVSLEESTTIEVLGSTTVAANTLVLGNPPTDDDVKGLYIDDNTFLVTYPIVDPSGFPQAIAANRLEHDGAGTVVTIGTSVCIVPDQATNIKVGAPGLINTSIAALTYYGSGTDIFVATFNYETSLLVAVSNATLYPSALAGAKEPTNIYYSGDRVNFIDEADSTMYQVTIDSLGTIGSHEVLGALVPGAVYGMYMYATSMGIVPYINGTELVGAVVDDQGGTLVLQSNDDVLSNNLTAFTQTYQRTERGMNFKRADAVGTNKAAISGYKASTGTQGLYLKLVEKVL